MLQAIMILLQSGEVLEISPEVTILGIAAGAAGTLFFVVRRYVDHRIDRAKREQEARLEQVRQRQELRLAEERAAIVREDNQVKKIQSLTDAVHDMAEVIAGAYKAIAERDVSAAKERDSFRQTLTANTLSVQNNAEILEENTEALSTLREEILNISKAIGVFGRQLDGLGEALTDPKSTGAVIDAISALRSEITTTRLDLQKVAAALSVEIEKPEAQKRATGTLPIVQINQEN